MALGSPCPQRDHTEHRSADEVALSVSSSLLGVAQTSFCFHLVVPVFRRFLSTTSIRVTREKAHHTGVQSLSVWLDASVFRLFVNSCPCVSVCLRVSVPPHASPRVSLRFHISFLLIVSPCVSLCSHASSCVSVCLLGSSWGLHRSKQFATAPIRQDSFRHPSYLGCVFALCCTSFQLFLHTCTHVIARACLCFLIVVEVNKFTSSRHNSNIRKL